MRAGVERADAAQPLAREVDSDALLVALVLVPHSYPRNRFFGMYEQREARRARRRAALIRSIAEDVFDGAEQLSVERAGEQLRLRYSLPGLAMVRTSLLDDDELALLQLLVERRRDGRAGLSLGEADPHACERVRQRLLRLL